MVEAMPDVGAETAVDLSNRPRDVLVVGQPFDHAVELLEHRDGGAGDVER
jgi:hypothetical protein